LDFNTRGSRPEPDKYRDFVAMLPMARANGHLPIVPEARPFVREIAGNFPVAPVRPPMVVRESTLPVKVPENVLLCTLDVDFKGDSVGGGTAVTWHITHVDRMLLLF
jgi:hypothetical protein